MAKADKPEPRKGPNELLQEFLEEHNITLAVRFISPSRESDVSLRDAMKDAIHPIYQSWTLVIRADWASRDE